MNRILRDQRGMTLIEIIVALALAGTLFLTVAQMLMQTTDLFYRADRVGRYETVGDTIGKYLENRMTDMDGVAQVDFNTMPYRYDLRLHVREGRLYADEIPVFDDSFYDQGFLTITLRCYDQAFDFFVILKDGDGKLLYEQEFPIGKNAIQKMQVTTTLLDDRFTFENPDIYFVYE